MTRAELIQELQVLCPYTLKGITGDVACGKVAEYILSRERLLLEKIGKLTNAISAIQMLIEEDIEERKGFTFNRKKMLDIAEEALK